MKKIFYFLALCIASPLVADSSLELSQGWRRDSLSFSISGPHKRPNVLSELHFKDIDVYMTHIWFKGAFDNLFFAIHGAYGEIVDGRVRDTDYLGNNRTHRFSQSSHDIRGDYTLDANVLIGIEKRLKDPTYIFKPLVGYGFYEQKLRMKHGTIDFQKDFHQGRSYHNEKVHGLNSTYRAKWFGPQLGAQLDKQVTTGLTAFIKYIFMYPLSYSGSGYWNMRDKRDRYFDDKANSYKSFGNIATLGALFQTKDSWDIRAEYEAIGFFAKDGHVHHRGYISAPFRKAKRIAHEIRLTIGYKF